MLALPGRQPQSKDITGRGVINQTTQSINLLPNQLPQHGHKSCMIGQFSCQCYVLYKKADVQISEMPMGWLQNSAHVKQHQITS